MVRDRLIQVWLYKEHFSAIPSLLKLHFKHSILITCSYTLFKLKSSHNAWENSIRSLITPQTVKLQLSQNREDNASNSLHQFVFLCVQSKPKCSWDKTKKRRFTPDSSSCHQFGLLSLAQPLAKQTSFDVSRSEAEKKLKKSKALRMLQTPCSNFAHKQRNN